MRILRIVIFMDMAYADRKDTSYWELVKRLGDEGLCSGGTKLNSIFITTEVVQIVLWIVDSGCSKHMTGDRSLLKNFVKKFMGLGHNLFSVGQFCDSDLEVTFRSNTCYVRNIEGDDLLIGARESNLYTISISDMVASSPVCLLSKATSTKSWLWHRRLSHLNFGIINDLTKHDLVDGLPKFKYSKDYLYSECERGKRKKYLHPPKVVPSNHSKLELLHMDLCGPMQVASINGKKYILVIVDDYSRFTWVYFLHTKDETPEIIKTFIARNTLRRDLLKYPLLPLHKVHNHEDSPSTSSIIIEEHDAPLIVTKYKEQTSPISLNEADEFNKKDSANFNGNTVFVAYDAPNFEEAESSTTALDPSNMHEFNQTDSELCMYALIVNTFEPKNIKEAMLDHSWIESMQDKLHQFERLDVWELVPLPDEKNIIAVKWL
ncbi:integrase, catalytic region, zinc finger, CCHC-type containing protein [Tanacetum coccineum]